ncbi:MAG: C40 family peptidase [Saprospiraceae bacterium]
MIKTDDLKTLFVVFIIAVTYAQCTSFQPITKGDSITRTETTTRPIDRNESQLRADVVRYAKKQLGAKYKYAGRSPQGFDCSGFTMYVLQEFDVDIPSGSYAQEEQGSKLNINQVAPGDLIFFRREKKGRVFHVAMVVENDADGLKVIHSTNRGVVIDNISNNSYWQPKISTARDVITP